MEVKAYIKNLKISPKKLRFLVDEIKKNLPVEAMNKLYYSPKRSAKILWKAIKSAVDNAQKNYGIKEDQLKFKLFIIEEGPRLKRFRPGGRGTIKPYRRRTSHIKIVLEKIESKTKIKS